MFSLVIMTEPYASHDASKIEPLSFGFHNLDSQLTTCEHSNEVP